LRVLAYRWPVHRLSPRYKPTEPPAEPTFTLAFRNTEQRVCFVSINSASARLLNLLQDKPELTGRQVVAELAQEMALTPEVLQGFARSLMQDFLSKGAILGVRV
jgi:hypothetical protein